MNISLFAYDSKGETVIGIIFKPNEGKNNYKKYVPHVEDGFNFDLAAPFRDAKWGMSREEILRLEKAYLIDDNSTRLLYQLVINNVKYLLTYTFDDNRLTKATYYTTEIFEPYLDYIDHYDDLKNELTKTYGKPSDGIMNWKYSENKSDQEEWEAAVKLGRLSILTQWDTASSNITLMLAGIDHSKGITITFEEPESGK